MGLLPLALQLYTVRDETARDFTGTLRRVAELGYDGVEFASYGGLPAAELQALLAELGLRVAGSHVPLTALETDLTAQIDYCLAIGCQTIVLPWLPPEKRSPADLRALAPQLNEYGARCNESGLAFSYHNHDFEFVQEEGSYLLDTLLEATDPSLVCLEFDIYWAAFKGVDPLEYLSKWPGRVRTVHLKDKTVDGAMTDVGSGTLDIPAIERAAAAAGAQWSIVENDHPVGPSLESAARSLAYLRTLA